MKTFKKCLAFLLVVLIVFGVSPANLLFGSGSIFELRAKAYFSEGIYDYGVITAPTQYAYITGLNQYVAGSVVVPSTLGGYPVYEIPSNLFRNNIDITSVTVQAGIVEIENEVFEGCKGLVSVSLPDGLETISYRVFADCTALQSIVIPDSVINFDYQVFNKCTSLTDADIGDGIVSLTSSTFSGCIALRNVILPANLQSIGYNAFGDCSALKNIAIPGSVTVIEGSVFAECTSLESIVLPNGLLTLGDWVFLRDTALVSVSLPDTLTSIGERAFSGCSSLQSIAIPAGVTEIPDSMCEDCFNLTSVSLPDTLTIIEDSAFNRCFKLTNINWPSDLTSIGNWAFDSCNFTSLYLPEGLLSIGTGAFNDCNHLKFAVIPSTVNALPNSLFKSCGYLVSVTIPDSVINFGMDIFTDCPNVTIYCYPSSVAVTYATAKSIPYIYITSVTVHFNANGGTPSMNYTQNCGTALTVPAVTKTGYTFAGWLPAVPAVMPAANTTYTAQWTVNKYLVEYRYGGTVTTYLLNYGDNMIPPLIFFQPDDLNVFTGWVPEVPASVPAQDSIYTAQYVPVYTYTVSDNKATITAVSTLVSGLVNIPAELDGYPVAGIGYHAFQNCTGITGITIPASVTFIDTRAFMGCTGLTAVTIPSGVTSIGNQAFQDCTALTSITVPASLAGIGGAAFANTAWMNAKPDGPVYIGSVLYRYKGNMPAGTTINVNAGTLGIAGSAFSGFSGLAHIALPEGLTNIGASAFRGCTGIAEIIVPISVTSIGSEAFENCIALTLGCYASSYAHTYANSNDIPHAIVVDITFDANGGTGGTSAPMYVGAPLSAPAVAFSSFVFNGWSPSVPSTVPEENTTYTAQWVTLLAYSIANSKVTITGVNATISGPVTIPAVIDGFPVTAIGASAFRDMTGITEVTFPDSLTSIGEQAFRGCTGLTSITLPSALITIESAAFIGCTNLTSIIIPASVRTFGTDVFTGCPGLILYVYPRSRAMLYAENNHLNYRVFVTVSFSLNGGTGTLPAPQSGLDGDEVTLPAQGDIARTGYHYLGWSPSPTATEAFANYTMAPANVTLYAVWSRIPSIAAYSGATTIINAQNGYIYGLAPGITQAEFESAYIALTGNGRLEYTLPSGGFGTGTQLNVIDNITDEVINTYTIIIFGDLNGDSSIDSIDAGKAVDFENYMVPWDPADDALYIKAGDLNGDGSVDSLDAGKIVDAENYIITVNQVTGQA